MWEGLFDFDWREVGYHLFQMSIAFVLALPVAWDQERATRRLGLRTFPLVALASTGFILVARSALGDDPAAQARALEGLITGVGFLGGGAILKHGTEIKGTATAASIWNTAALGAAVAYGRYEIALLLALMNFFVLRTFRVIKKYLGLDDEDETESGPDWEDGSAGELSGSRGARAARDAETDPYEPPLGRPPGESDD